MKSLRDLKTFEGWLRYYGVDAATATPDELEMQRAFFDEARKRTLAKPKVGLMKLQTVPGEHRYSVAVREGSDLWLVLWVRRSRKGECLSCCRASIKIGTFTQVITSTAGTI